MRGLGHLYPPQRLHRCGGLWAKEAISAAHAFPRATPPCLQDFARVASVPDGAEGHKAPEAAVLHALSRGSTAASTPALLSDKDACSATSKALAGCVKMLFPYFVDTAKAGTLQLLQAILSGAAAGAGGVIAALLRQLPGESTPSSGASVDARPPPFHDGALPSCHRSRQRDLCLHSLVPAADGPAPGTCRWLAGR